jgi:hypothetical protein
LLCMFHPEMFFFKKKESGRVLRFGRADICVGLALIQMKKPTRMSALQQPDDLTISP